MTAMLLSGHAVEAAPCITASSSVVMGEAGEILYEKNSQQKLPVASTTKIMTAIVVLENCSLDDVLQISYESCNVEGSSMYLSPGEEYTVKELLQGMMLVSGNDAATALAIHTAGNIEKFSELMNQKCRELGMENSNFKNPHGLSEEGHYSTALDMAKLMVYCMKNSNFAELTACRAMSTETHSFINHNKLLYICPGCIGGKTGYTLAAGRCLVSVCRREDAQLVCVTLSAPDDWNDHMKLYNWAYSQFTLRNLSEKMVFDIPVVSGKADKAVLAAKDCQLLLPTKSKIIIRVQLPHFEFAPIAQGDEGGSYKAYCEGELIAEGKLLYQTEVEVSS